MFTNEGGWRSRNDLLEIAVVRTVDLTADNNPFQRNAKHVSEHVLTLSASAARTDLNAINAVMAQIKAEGY